jgi:flagellar hook-length control protein FliK
MNLQLSSRAPALPASLPALNADPARPDAAGSSAFAGLLGEQMQSRATEGRRAGERNAFDVPAARAEARRTEPQAERPPSRSAESNATPEQSARREPAKERQAAAPASSGAAAEERLRAARKAAAGGSARADGAKPAADREPAQSTADTSAQVADEDQDANPAEQRRTQAVIDWLSRTDPTNTAPKDLVTEPPSGASTATSLAAGLPSAAGEFTALAEADGSAAAKGSAVAGAAVELRDPAAHHAAASRAGDRAAAAAAIVEAQDAALAGMGLATAELADKGSAASTLAATGATDLPAAAASAHSPTATATSSPLVGSAASPATAPAPQLVLSTPVTSPDFSQALAAQLTTLARDGIQQATLQLHPTEMGPIEVNIVLDGAQAQVDFSAAHALTRQAIESGLPSLAAALHGAGLTLSGGGVFEQRPGTPGGRASGQEGGTRGAAGGPDGELDVGSMPAPRHQVVRGLVDVYA